MDEQLRVGIAFAIFVAAFVVCYIRVFLKGTSRKQKFVAKAKEKGCYTQGDYVTHKFRGGSYDSTSSSYRDDQHIVKYEYQVNGKTYYKKLRFRAKSGAVEQPRHITVYYDSSNPKKAIAANEANQGAQRNNGCLLTIIIPIVAYKLVYFLLGML